MTEATPFLQKNDITFLRPPTIRWRVIANLSQWEVGLRLR